MLNFQDLFNRYAFHAFENQMRLWSLVGDYEWLLDTEKAIITFNNDLIFAVQYLGTESEVTNTWLWADANDKVAFPEHSLEFCRALRAYCSQHGLDEFAQDKFEFKDEVGKPDGHKLAMVSTCLAKGSCYYRCPHEYGAVYVILKDPRIDAQPDLDLEGFNEAFNSIMWQTGDMKKQIVSYCSQKGYIDKNWDGSELICTLYTGERFRIFFKQMPNGGMKIRFDADLTDETNH